MYHEKDSFISNYINTFYAREKNEGGENKDSRRQTNNHKSANDYSPGIEHIGKSL